MAVNADLAEQVCEFLNDMLVAEGEEGDVLAALVWGCPITDLPQTMSTDEMEEAMSAGLVGIANRACGQEKGERAPIEVKLLDDGRVEKFSLQLGSERPFSE